MRLHWRIALLSVLFNISSPVAATVTSFRNAHPVGWMHLLPVGESPGWSTNQWVDIELNHANIWNDEFTMTDDRNGNEYSYKADFEQSSAIYDMGLGLTDSLAFGLEIPYANRNGGFLDDFIDQFHTMIGSDRFMRHVNDEFGNSFVIKTNGEPSLATDIGQGVGNVKAKLKWWPLQWRSATPGVCDCGFALSAQAKFPTQTRTHGMSSGYNDYSGLAHLGAPLGDYSAVWATAAVTKLGANDNFPEWPRRDWLQMYELRLDLGVGPNFALVLQCRTESPLFRQEDLTYSYQYSDADSRVAERVASGWNSLTAWRGSQSIGFRWRWGEGSQVNLLMVEDWGWGDRDSRADWLYVNNAPDVAFISQWHFAF